MIEKTQIANLHGFHIIASLIVAHPVPAFPDIALIQLILPGPGIWFGFKKPVCHLLSLLKGVFFARDIYLYRSQIIPDQRGVTIVR